MNEISVNVRPISVAVLAIGGEGGGVLADWIAGLAEQNGYLAQTTSVPGVAQRTGATIYYVEMFPVAAAAAGRNPILALMPVPGDVDIVIASELLEAARAVERGLVTPDRTTLIASTHRVYAMSERTALADGRADAREFVAMCRTAARRMIAFDMEGIAEATNSMVSAVLFGALARSGTLPFPRAAFESTIRKAGVGVATSLAAFTAGFEAADEAPAPTIAPDEKQRERNYRSAIDPLLSEISGGATPETLALLEAGVSRLIDYQDAEYARLFLERLKPVHRVDGKHGDGQSRLLGEAARQLALAMSYEDSIRVADLKIRSERFARVREEVKLADGQILEIVEFLHPRTEEIADTLPAGVGRWLLRTKWARWLVGRFTRSGRMIKTSSIRGFLLLYLVASLRPLRRRSLRFAVEQSEIDSWLETVIRIASQHYELAVGVARLRGLIKGYGDTHAGGREKYQLVARQLPALENHTDAAQRLSKLLVAANADESGAVLRAAIEAQDN